jgi:hypothetical protein
VAISGVEWEAAVQVAIMLRMPVTLMLQDPLASLLLASLGCKLNFGGYVLNVAVNAIIRIMTMLRLRKLKVMLSILLKQRLKEFKRSV